MKSGRGVARLRECGEARLSMRSTAWVPEELVHVCKVPLSPHGGFLRACAATDQLHVRSNSGACLAAPDAWERGTRPVHTVGPELAPPPKCNLS